MKCKLAKLTSDPWETLDDFGNLYKGSLNKPYVGCLAGSCRQQVGIGVMMATCPVQLPNEIQAALCRRHMVSCNVPSIRNLFSIVWLGFWLFFCIRETLCAEYTVCQESYYVGILGNPHSCSTH